MNIQDYRALKDNAREALSGAAYSPRKLFTIHIAVSAGIALIISLISFLLNRGIASTGGLDGIGTRALLETVQTLLETANSLALPFWQIGLVFASLLLIRRQTAEPHSLLEGFRRLGPVLRLYILKVLIVIALIMICSNAASFLMVLLPLSTGFLSLMESIPETATEEEILRMMEDPAFSEQMLRAMVPMLLAMLALMLICIIPIMFRLRMTDYLIMDNPEAGARAAVKTSWRMTKGNCMALFRLDLSFWWFYVLNTLVSVVYFLDMLLPQSVNPDVSFILCGVGYAIGQVALYSWANAYLQTTYAAFYEALREKLREEEAQRLAAAAAVVTPWDVPPQPEQ